MTKLTAACLSACLLWLQWCPSYGEEDAQWHVGVGIADCTGPAAEVVMMGYADNEHKTAGIHMRLHARAFVFLNPETQERVAFVNADTWAATEAVIQGVENRLHQWFGGRHYSRDNLIVAGSHTHHGPAGASAYYLFQFSSFGYVEQSLTSLVDGISEAVWLAHHNVKPANVTINSGMVDNSTVPGCPMPNCASINRSPTSFLHNPEKDRKQYFGDDNLDREMPLVKIVDAHSGQPMGVLNWFAVHTTSMNSDHDLISGDNKGVAEYLFERAVNGPPSQRVSGRGPFIAAFAQGASGDVSPNVNGSFCTNTGLSCENQYSVCWEGGQHKNELCRGRGPSRDAYESTRIIGERQFKAAKHIFDRAATPIGAGLNYAVRFADLSKYWVDLDGNGTWAQTCSPCLGTAFAAGTTDGPSGVNEFGQNMTPSNGFLQFIAHMISMPTEEEKSCQAPKNILLHPGGMNLPYPFFPSVLGFQMMRIGSLIIVAVPGEFTTMAGKKTREAIKAVFVEKGVVNETAMVVLNNVASGYAGYITTFEEYQHQRYEGGFTAYGPHTHKAMTQILVEMAQDLADGKHTYPGMKPKLPTGARMVEGQAKVVVDDPPVGGKFGDVKEDVTPGTYHPGATARVEIWGAHPRNDPKRNSSFGTVWYWESDNSSDSSAGAGGKWKLVADDNDFETKFEWKRVGISASVVTLSWDIPPETLPGWYLMHYSGNAKRLGGVISPISGSSRIFEVRKEVWDAPPKDEMVVLPPLAVDDGEGLNLPAEGAGPARRLRGAAEYFQ